MNANKINDIDTTQLSVVVEVYCIVEVDQYDFGSLRLKQGNKDLILDVTRSEWDNNNNHTTITCSLEFDDDIDDSFKNNMALVDLYQKFDTATFYIGCEYEIEPESITLVIKNNSNTTCRDLEIEL